MAAVGASVLPRVPPALVEQGIGLRAEESEDGPFLTRLYLQNRWEELAPTGWPDARKAAFLTQQSGWQHDHYRRHYVGAAWGIVTKDGEPIGRLYLHAMPGELRIVDILLLPAHRGRGIGGALIEAVFASARVRGDAVTIHVEVFNPARRLYERLGFVEAGGGDIYRKMEWRS